MSEQINKSALKRDFKKILPVWGIIVAVAILALLFLKLFNNRIINYIQYPPDNPYLLAKALEEEGIKYYIKALDKFQKISSTEERKYISGDPDLEKSKSLLLKSLELFHPNPQIYKRLATLAEMENDVAMTYYYQAHDLFYHKRREEAIAFLDKALAHAPDNEKVLEKKIDFLIVLDDIEQASKTIERLMEVNPNNANAYFHAAKIAYLRNNVDKSWAFFEKTLELDPQHLEAARVFAKLLVDRKAYDRAIDVLTPLEQFYPNNARLKHAIGRIFFLKEQYEVAYDYYQKAEKLEKNSAALYLDLSRVCEKLGKKRLSSIYLKRAIDLDPELKDTLLSSEL